MKAGVPGVLALLGLDPTSPVFHDLCPLSTSKPSETSIFGPGSNFLKPCPSMLWNPPNPPCSFFPSQHPLPPMTKQRA